MFVDSWRTAIAGDHVPTHPAWLRENTFRGWRRRFLCAERGRIVSRKSISTLHLLRGKLSSAVVSKPTGRSRWWCPGDPARNMKLMHGPAPPRICFLAHYVCSPCRCRQGIKDSAQGSPRKTSPQCGYLFCQRRGRFEFGSCFVCVREYIHLATSLGAHPR